MKTQEIFTEFSDLTFVEEDGKEYIGFRSSIKKLIANGYFIDAIASENFGLNKYIIIAHKIEEPDKKGL